VLGNHDRPRIAAKRGQAQARVAAKLLLTLRGTPTLYYGDELGLSDVAISAAHVQDPRGLREPGLTLGRDPVRTPMPWDASENAGFTMASPWLPLNADWPTRNVARMADEPHSILTLYRRLLAIRRAHHRLQLPDWAGDCRPLLSTIADAAPARDGVLLLRGNEGVILTPH
jgi:glycosidase